MRGRTRRTANDPTSRLLEAIEDGTMHAMKRESIDFTGRLSSATETEGGASGSAGPPTKYNQASILTRAGATDQIVPGMSLPGPGGA
jgi:hypothetical protein